MAAIFELALNSNPTNITDLSPALKDPLFSAQQLLWLLRRCPNYGLTVKLSGMMSNSSKNQCKVEIITNELKVKSCLHQNFNIFKKMLLHIFAMLN